MRRRRVAAVGQPQPEGLGAGLGQPEQPEALVRQPGRRQVARPAGRRPADARHQRGGAEPRRAAQEPPSCARRHAQSPSIALNPLVTPTTGPTWLVTSVCTRFSAPCSASTWIRPCGVATSTSIGAATLPAALATLSKALRTGRAWSSPIAGDEHGLEQRLHPLDRGQQVRQRPPRAPGLGPPRLRPVEGAERPAEPQVDVGLQPVGERRVERPRRLLGREVDRVVRRRRRWSGYPPQGSRQRVEHPRARRRHVAGDRDEQPAAVAARPRPAPPRGRTAAGRAPSARAPPPRPRRRRRDRRPPDPRPRPAPPASAASSPWCRARTRSRSRCCPPRPGRSGCAGCAPRRRRPRHRRSRPAGSIGPSPAQAASAAASRAVRRGVQALEAGEDVLVQRPLGERRMIGLRRGRRGEQEGEDRQHGRASITATPGSGSARRGPRRSSPPPGRAPPAPRRRARAPPRAASAPARRAGSSPARSPSRSARSPRAARCATRLPLARASGRWSASPSPMSCSSRSV